MPNQNNFDWSNGETVWEMTCYLHCDNYYSYMHIKHTYICMYIFICIHVYMHTHIGSCIKPKRKETFNAMKSQFMHFSRLLYKENRQIQIISCHNIMQCDSTGVYGNGICLHISC